MILALFSSSFLIIPKGFLKDVFPPFSTILNLELVLFTRIPCCLSSAAIAKLNPIFLYEYLVCFSLMSQQLSESYFGEDFRVF